MNYGGGFDMGASQFAGGGFVPSPAAGADTGYGGYQKQNAKSAPQTMRDVTIRQLIRENMHSSDDQCKVDGIELTTFFIVGRIVSRIDNSTTLQLKVDDGTGIIEVKHYMEDSNDLINMATQEWVLNQWVRVCGSLRSMEGKRSLQAFRIKLVKDFNEVTYHNLQCIFQHLHLTKGGAPPAAAPQGMPGAGGMSGGFQGNVQSAQAAPGMGGNKLHMDILAIYNESVHIEQGLSLDHVTGTLHQRGLNYSMHHVTEAVEFMTNEGQLYSTIDDRHHRSTAM